MSRRPDLSHRGLEVRGRGLAQHSSSSQSQSQSTDTSLSAVGGSSTDAPPRGLQRARTAGLTSLQHKRNSDAEGAATPRGGGSTVPRPRAQVPAAPAHSTAIQTSLVQNLKQQVACLEAQLQVSRLQQEAVARSRRVSQNTSVADLAPPASPLAPETPSEPLSVPESVTRHGGVELPLQHRSRVWPTDTSTVSEDPFDWSEGSLTRMRRVPASYQVERNILVHNVESLTHDVEGLQSLVLHLARERDMMAAEVADFHGALREARVENDAMAAECAASLQLLESERALRRAAEDKADGSTSNTRAAPSSIAASDAVSQRDYFKLQVDRLTEAAARNNARTQSFIEALRQERQNSKALETQLRAAVNRVGLMERREEEVATYYQQLSARFVTVSSTLQHVLDAVPEDLLQQKRVPSPERTAGASGDRVTMREVRDTLKGWQREVAVEATRVQQATERVTGDALAQLETATTSTEVAGATEKTSPPPPHQHQPPPPQPQSPQAHRRPLAGHAPEPGAAGLRPASSTASLMFESEEQRQLLFDSFALYTAAMSNPGAAAHLHESPGDGVLRLTKTLKAMPHSPSYTAGTPTTFASPTVATFMDSAGDPAAAAPGASSPEKGSKGPMVSAVLGESLYQPSAPVPVPLPPPQWSIAESSSGTNGSAPTTTGSAPSTQEALSCNARGKDKAPMPGVSAPLDSEESTLPSAPTSESVNGSAQQHLRGTPSTVEATPLNAPTAHDTGAASEAALDAEDREKASETLAPEAEPPVAQRGAQDEDGAGRAAETTEAAPGASPSAVQETAENSVAAPMEEPALDIAVDVGSSSFEPSDGTVEGVGAGGTPPPLTPDETPAAAAASSSSPAGTASSVAIIAATSSILLPALSSTMVPVEGRRQADAVPGAAAGTSGDSAEATTAPGEPAQESKRSDLIAEALQPETPAATVAEPVRRTSPMEASAVISVDPVSVPETAIPDATDATEAEATPTADDDVSPPPLPVVSPPLYAVPSLPQSAVPPPPLFAAPPPPPPPGAAVPLPPPGAAVPPPPPPMAVVPTGAPPAAPTPPTIQEQLAQLDARIDAQEAALAELVRRHTSA